MYPPTHVSYVYHPDRITTAALLINNYAVIGFAGEGFKGLQFSEYPYGSVSDFFINFEVL